MSQEREPHRTSGNPQGKQTRTNREPRDQQEPGEKKTGAATPVKQGQDKTDTEGQSRQKTHRGPAGLAWTSP